MTTLRPLEAENAVIGSILISPECLPVAAGILSPGDFGLEANRQLFQAALALTRRESPPTRCCWARRSGAWAGPCPTSTSCS